MNLVVIFTLSLLSFLYISSYFYQNLLPDRKHCFYFIFNISFLQFFFHCLYRWNYWIVFLNFIIHFNWQLWLSSIEDFEWTCFVEECLDTLIANKTELSISSQFISRGETCFLILSSIVLWLLSSKPFLCGWYTAIILCYVLINL